MTYEASTIEVLERIEEAQAALRQMLRPIESALLYERPSSGDWSPVENVRHLIFAEQHHFSRYLRGFRWSSVGVPSPSMTGERRLSPAGRDPASAVDELFEVWDRVHAVVRARCLESPDGVLRSLQGNLEHLDLHTRVIEELLRGSSNV